MQFHFSFKHMDTSPALQEYAEQKVSEKIQKFVTKPIASHVTFSVTRHQHTVHISFDGGDGFESEVEHTSEDMYASLDQACEKLGTQLKKHKEKLKDHKSSERHPMTAETLRMPVAEAVDADEILRYEAQKRAAAR